MIVSINLTLFTTSAKKEELIEVNCPFLKIKINKNERFLFTAYQSLEAHYIVAYLTSSFLRQRSV